MNAYTQRFLNGSTHLTALGIVAAAIEDEINTAYLPDMPDTDMVAISLSVCEVRRILTASSFEVALGACEPGTIPPRRERLALQGLEGVF